ncbi:hypothetical protein CYMTET_50824 [Cymbomonas tetramitiformis]|uniref:Acyltransferase n=1 Tax=Cymbomonas tetramitiformis TaxID=36881 RepID=A0AAE0BNZ9_9CHLO|nr:hypothetical protein CYMTET_50824 [Cymbomonas tetramitiformis]
MRMPSSGGPGAPSAPCSAPAALRTFHLPNTSGGDGDELGHAMMMEDMFSISDIIEEEGFYTRRRTTTAVAKRPPKGTLSDPMEVPTSVEARKATEGGLDFLQRLTSPVFFSTREADGQVVTGLSELPETRPVLFVGNHQTYATDLGPLIAGVLEEKGMLIRGLAHPMAFQGFRASEDSTDEAEGRSGQAQQPGQGPGSAGLLSAYGAVPVSARNMYNLLNNGEAVLLYPGGVREAYKRKGEEYKLIWPDKPEVIRMAARFGATIVPLSAVGIDDNVDIIADAEDLLSLPVLGDYIRDRTSGIPTARNTDATPEIDETFIAPIPAPQTPGRYYFLFGTPIRTDPSMVKDGELAEDLYKKLKSGVEEGIEYLCTKRDEDPYSDFFKRLVYEASWGGTKQAPTFKP